MKGTGTLVASVMAASTVALSSTSHPSFYASASASASAAASEGFSSSSGTNTAPNSHAPSDKGKFAPRFDGLRFIETLVTAHR